MGTNRAGRKPKGTAQHKADGTYQRCRHGGRADVAIGGTRPIHPDGLKKHGKQLWKTINERLPASLLDSLDTAKLDVLCRTYDRWKAAKTATEFLQLAQLLDRIGRQFGLSPMDRASIKTKPDSEQDDEAEKYKQEMGFKAVG